MSNLNFIKDANGDSIKFIGTISKFGIMMKYNLNDTKLAVKSLDVLGFTIKKDEQGRTTREPIKKHHENFLQKATPTSASQMRSFLGLARVLAPFSPGLSVQLAPLNKLAHKANAFKLENTHLQLIEEIKQQLTDIDKLYFYDPRYPIIAATDACNEGIGGVIYQVDDDGEYRILNWFSEPFSTQSRRNWPINKKECYAMNELIVKKYGFDVMEKLDSVIRGWLRTAEKDPSWTLSAGQKKWLNSSLGGSTPRGLSETIRKAIIRECKLVGGCDLPDQSRFRFGQLADKFASIRKRSSRLPSWIKSQAVNIFGPGYSYESDGDVYLIDMGGYYGFAMEFDGDWEIADEIDDKGYAVMRDQELGIGVRKSDLSD